MKHTFDAKSRIHTWTYGGSVPPLTFDENEAEQTRETAATHGWKQKIGDAAAIAKDTSNGRSATDADKRAEMQAVVDRLYDGEWNAPAKGGGVRVVNMDALVAAMAAVLKKNVVGVRAYIEERDDAGRKALANSKQFQAAYNTALAQMRPVRELDEATLEELDAIPD